MYVKVPKNLRRLVPVVKEAHPRGQVVLIVDRVPHAGEHHRAVLASAVAPEVQGVLRRDLALHGRVCEHAATNNKQNIYKNMCCSGKKKKTGRGLDTYSNGGRDWGGGGGARCVASALQPTNNKK